MALISSRALVAIGVSVGVLMSPAAAQGMMRRDVRDARMSKSPVQLQVEKVLQGGAAERLLAVEASVRPTYEAFPKNSQGRIPPSEIFPAIVRGYFAKEHGWLLAGLAPPNLTPKLSEVHEALVLREQAPSLARALKDLHEADKGLSLGDVVGTIAAIEHLLLSESEALLQGAYILNELSVNDLLDSEVALKEVLHSFLLLQRHGHPYNLTNLTLHRRMKARAQKAVAEWKHLEEYASEAIRNSGTRSPFPFSAVTAMAKDLTLGYGRWQNGECMQMKATLLELADMDVRTNGTGKVLYSNFHAERKHTTYQFTETEEYLRKYGVLDEEGDEPRVRIANYLLAPSNCIASSKHYSVCCLSECEALTSDLELRVQAPVWPAPRLLGAVGELPSSTLAAPRELAASLRQELETIATAHDGAVPLHSAEFRQWLHSAFPNECPMPTASEGAAEEWERHAAESWLATQQECTRIPQWHPIAHGEAVVNV